MKILLTGGAGFIGSHLCDALIAEGNHIVALDNLILGRIENIKHLMNHKQFSFIKSDILDYSALSELFRTECFDEVYHLAANSDIQKGKPRTHLEA
jgi:UDP-glucose 4-epimerase